MIQYYMKHTLTVCRLYEIIHYDLNDSVNILRKW